MSGTAKRTTPITSPLWAQGDIVRNRSTNQPLLVLHVYKGVSTIVIDMLDPSHMPLTYALLPREYDQYKKED